MRPGIDRICAEVAFPVRSALPAPLASSLGRRDIDAGQQGLCGESRIYEKLIRLDACAANVLSGSP